MPFKTGKGTAGTGREGYIMRHIPVSMPFKTGKGTAGLKRKVAWKIRRISFNAL